MLLIVFIFSFLHFTTRAGTATLTGEELEKIAKIELKLFSLHHLVWLYPRAGKM